MITKFDDFYNTCEKSGYTNMKYESSNYGEPISIWEYCYYMAIEHNTNVNIQRNIYENYLHTYNVNIFAGVNVNLLCWRDLIKVGDNIWERYKK